MSISIAVIGSGFGGLAAAIELKKRGHDDIVILEKADGIGGTWRDNTYPGAACDVPSPFYSYSFEPYTVWPHRFSRQPVILDYIKHVAEKYDLTAPRPARHRGARRVLRRGCGQVDGRARRGRGARRRRPGLSGRPAVAAVVPRHRGRRHVRRPELPLGDVGPRRRPGGQAGRRDRHRRQRDPVRAGHPARGRAPVGLPAHAAVPRPPDGPRVLEEPPQGLREGAGDPARGARHLVRRHRGPERRLGLLQDADEGHQGGFPAAHAQAGRGEARSVREDLADLPDRLQADPVLERLRARAGAAERRPGHRRHRGDHSHRGPDRRRHRASRRRDHLGHRVQGHRVPLPDDDHRAPRAATSIPSGRTARTPTTASPCPASPTC